MNEKYQKNIEVFHKKKFLSKNYKHQYQGDKVSLLLFSLIKRHTKLKSKILDVGAGTGALVKLLRDKGYKNANGIDLYPKVNFIKEGKITSLNFSDAYYNTVFCTEVLEHLTTNQIEKGLREIRRVLKTEGNFIVTVPYNENLEKNSFVCPKCGHRFHRVGHLQSFNKKRIGSLLKNHGFKIIFMKVYALGAMAKLPLGRYLNFLFKRLEYDSISKTLVIVAKKI